MNFLCIKRGDSPPYFPDDDLISLHYGNTLFPLLNPAGGGRQGDVGNVVRQRRGKEEPSVLAPLTFGIINYPHYGDYRSKVLLQLAERDRERRRRGQEGKKERARKREEGRKRRTAREKKQ